MGARISERTLWQMRGESAAHGNALPIIIQHALCPPCKSRGLAGQRLPRYFLQFDTLRPRPHQPNREHHDQHCTPVVPKCFNTAAIRKAVKIAENRLHE
jgi:hypothetical protein